jgi:hypothetical protein
MRELTVILVIALAALQARADVRLFAWQESREEKTDEKQFGFCLAPSAVMKFMEADGKGDRKTAESLAAGLRKDAWAYVLKLTGELGVYSKERVVLCESGPCGSMIEIESGSVDVDWNAKTVRVGLKVVLDGKPVDFRGNGTYRIRKKPPQSTTPAVTPPAGQEARQP